MSEEIRCVLMTAPRAPLELRRVPAPRAAPGGAVLEMLASEVCGTDVHLHHGQLAGVPYPIVPGHVSVGRVLETGGTLRDVGGEEIGVGRLVTFYDVFGVCGACWHCLVAKAATRCPAAPGLRDHDRDRRRRPRRLGRADRDPAGGAACCRCRTA